MPNKLKYAGLAILIIFGTMAPLFIHDLKLRILIEICMYAGLALSWNLISGITGYISFGHVLFFGVGGYTTAILMVKYHVNFFPALMLSALFAAVLALLIGGPLLRSRGPYFAIATLGVAEASKEIFGVAKIFGAGKGWALPINHSSILIYYILFSILVILGLITCFFLNSRFGLGLMAIREDEDVAKAIGINTTRFKIIAYVLSAVFVGVIGGANAYYISFVDNTTAFDSEISLTMLVMVLIGGLGTLWGPIIGTVFMTLVSHYLWGSLPQVHQMTLGLLIMIVVLFLPNGIMPFLRGKQKLTLRSLRNTLRNTQV